MTYLIILLTSSNVFLLISTIFFYLKSKKTKARKESIELQDFLSDLLAGGSLIHVQRIAAADSLIHMRNRNE